MTVNFVRSFAIAAALAGAVPNSCTLAQAQTTAPAQPSAPAAARPGAATPAPVVEDGDANDIRRDFIDVMRRYPPSLGQVLKLDPSLLSNEGYLQSYPALAAFLADHPNVRHNPSYFLQHVDEPETPVARDPRFQAVAMWKDMLEGVSVFVIIVTFLMAFIWFVRTLIDHRRWGRLQKVQTEVHTKLLDRFSATDDVLRYMQTSAGRRFLESAPIPVDSPRGISAPLGRILWSVQVGLVLITGGVGLQIVGGRVPEEVSSPLAAMGVLGMALGIGFLLAAGVSFVLSRRLGLFDAAAVPATDEGRVS